MPIRESINSDNQESNYSHSIIPLINPISLLEQTINCELRQRKCTLNVSIDCDLGSTLGNGSHKVILPLCGDNQEIVEMTSEADSIEADEVKSPSKILASKERMTDININLPSSRCADHSSISADYQKQKRNYI